MPVHPDIYLTRVRLLPVSGGYFDVLIRQADGVHHPDCIQVGSKTLTEASARRREWIDTQRRAGRSVEGTDNIHRLTQLLFTGCVAPGEIFPVGWVLRQHTDAHPTAVYFLDGNPVTRKQLLTRLKTEQDFDQAVAAGRVAIAVIKK